MSLSATTTVNVVSQTPQSAAVDVVIQPPAALGTPTARGRLIHPTLGVYDYVNTPDETVNIDGDVCYKPIWAHSMTLGGGVDALWPGFIRDVEVIERWVNGEMGSVIEHLRQLWQFFVNPPDPGSGQYIIWAPNYATNRTYYVAIVDITSGGEQYKLNRRYANWGWAPQPVELKIRVIGYAS